MREIFLLLFAVLIHEFGHLAAAKLLGVGNVSFALKSMGGIFTFDFSHTSFIREIIVHLSGSVFGLISAAAAYALFRESALFFVGVSVSLSIVNLLPIFGFDGGGILFSFLSIFLLPDDSYKICGIVSNVVSAVLWAVVINTELKYSVNLGLLCFSITVFLSQLRLNRT